MKSNPALSIVVIAYDMAGQLANSLRTLSADYQQEVSADDFEVIIVENRSANTLDQTTLDSLPKNFCYYLREETSRSPAAAINFALEQARGENIGLMIDGAHMLTPGVVGNASMAFAMSEDAFVTVPTYHLGPAEQNLSTLEGFDEQEQDRLLASINWQSDGYQLFSISALCGANPRGYFAPIMESNCYFAPRQSFIDIGGADESYQQAGGGSLNLDLVRKLGTLPGTDFFTLAGEGSFHQYHGGVTSNKSRSEHVDKFRDELHDKWEQQYHFLERNPIILGQISEPAEKYLEFSSYRMLKRFDNFRDRLDQVWSDDRDCAQ